MKPSLKNQLLDALQAAISDLETSLNALKNNNRLDIDVDAIAEDLGDIRALIEECEADEAEEARRAKEETEYREHCKQVHEKQRLDQIRGLIRSATTIHIDCDDPEYHWSGRIVHTER